jgi:hypothetical protein
MLGRAAIAMWWDIPPGMNAEFEDWHSHEHMPERLSIPGFLRGTRWTALSGAPSYFVLYEAARLATITGGPYLERLNDPTPWSRKMMPHHLNMVRSLCHVRAAFGGGVAHALATIRFSSAPRRRAPLFKWLASQALPALPARKGLTSAHLLESHDPAAAGPTTEQRIRGGDGVADVILLVGGYDVEAVESVLANELRADRVASHGALPGRVEGLYRPAFSLTARDNRTRAER